jgi:GntR family transcriptional regulator
MENKKMADTKELTIGSKIEEIIKTRIQQGYYKVDGKLPSENDLAKEFNVSRSSIRTALASLAGEHIIIRKQGHGTRINGEFANSLASFNKTWEFTNLIRFNGKTPSIRAVSLLYRLPNSDEVEKLQISYETQIVSIDRVFFADETPVIFSNNIVPTTDLKKEVTLHDANYAITDFIFNFSGQHLVYGMSEISAAMPAGNIAQNLKISIQTPLLKFSELFFRSDGKPLVIAHSWFDSKNIKLSIPRSFE